MYEANDELPLVRNLNEDTGHFDYAKIAKVFKNDLKELFQVTLKDGRTLKCSMDHRIFTENGWKRLYELNPGDEVACNGTVQTLVKITSIEYLRADVTYDIEVDGKYHNFVCDGIVVHNCQSQRYTGKRVVKVANNQIPVDEVFYVRPPGHYTNRQGKKYIWTQEDHDDEINWIYQGCQRYAEKYEKGMCEEHIRDYLTQAIRQNFVVSFNLRSILHMMDLRAKRDAQLEIQALMEQLAPNLEKWAPNVWKYYSEKRLYKARLSP
jgi:thymidylate synthase (FAD)